jgi:hypothetical protein
VCVCVVSECESEFGSVCVHGREYVCVCVYVCMCV